MAVSSDGGAREGEFDEGGDRDISRVQADEVPTEGSVSSSQLLSGPACSTTGVGGFEALDDGASADLSIDAGLSNDGSYFILDEGGRHVLDDQGSPARARKWRPVNAHQRERYT